MEIEWEVREKLRITPSLSMKAICGRHRRWENRILTKHTQLLGLAHARHILCHRHNLCPSAQPNRIQLRRHRLHDTLICLASSSLSLRGQAQELRRTKVVLSTRPCKPTLETIITLVVHRFISKAKRDKSAYTPSTPVFPIACGPPS